MTGAPGIRKSAQDWLSATPFAGWTVQPMTGDASVRRYARLVNPDPAGAVQSAILMDAAPDRAGSSLPFVTLADHLRGLGLAAPGILVADLNLGLLVIEDLGPDTFAQFLAREPAAEPVLYAAAVDMLIDLHRHAPPPGLVPLVPTRAAGMIAPLFEWYMPRPDARALAAITGRLQAALLARAPDANRFALRDCHAENLIWRPDRSGLDRVGLLDFQDAVLAAPEYDLVSLLRDARRDVSPHLRAEMLARFAAGTARAPETVAAAAAVIGVQRNLRILGIFARLARRDGKAQYLDFMPRVWAQIDEDLSHPALADVAVLVRLLVPPPGPAHLAQMVPA